MTKHTLTLTLCLYFVSLAVLLSSCGSAQTASTLPWLCPATSIDGLSFTCTATLLDGTAIPFATLTAPVTGQQVILVPQAAAAGGLASTLSVNGSVSAAPLRRVNKRTGGLRGSPYFTGDTLKLRDLDTGCVYTAYWTGTTWRTSTPPATTTSTGILSFPSLATGQCTSTNLSFVIANAALDSNVTVTPQGDPGDGVYAQGYVTNPGIVLLKVCAVVAVTPNNISYLIGVQ